MDFDLLAHQYNDVLNQQLNLSGEDWSYFSEYKALYLKRIFGHDYSGKILDYGCGIGNLCGFIKTHLPECQLDGFDPSAQSIEKIPPKLKKSGNFTANDAELPNDYNMIVLANVMHHVPPPKRRIFIESLSKKIKKGGSLIIFEHNPLNPLTQWSVRRSPIDKGVKLLPNKETKAYLNMAGIIEVNCDFIVFFPRSLKIFRRFEPSLAWCPAGAQYVIRGIKTD